MSNTQRMDFNTDVGKFFGAIGAWEPVTYYDVNGNPVVWQAATVFDGQIDTNIQYQVDNNGNIFQVETGSLDNNVPIKIRLTTKRFPVEQIGLFQQTFIRLAGLVQDTVTMTVTTGGSEYGPVTRNYTLNLAGADDLEIKTRLERELLGRWVQIQITGSVSNLPAFRDMLVWWLPHRNARVSVPT